MNTATLLITCDDRPGLVSTFSQFIAANGGNILDVDQHAEDSSGKFFMRLVYDAGSFALDDKATRMGLDGLARSIPGLSWQLFQNTPKPKVALMCSKTAHCLYDLLSRHELGEFSGQIAVIVSNHNDLCEVAEHFGVPFCHVPAPKVDTPDREQAKAAMEARHEEIFAEYGVDMVVLARYMQVVSADFCQRWAGRCINIHHSFLPAFVGAKPYHQAFERGVKIIGATAHYVTANLDQGPIIEQDVSHVGRHNSPEDFVRIGRDTERQVLARAVRWHLERRVIIHGNRTVVFA